MNRRSKNVVALFALFVASLVSLSFFQLANTMPAEAAHTSASHASYSWHTNRWQATITTTTSGVQTGTELDCEYVVGSAPICNQVPVYGDKVKVEVAPPYPDAGCQVTYLAKANEEGCGAHAPADEFGIGFGGVSIVKKTAFYDHSAAHFAGSPTTTTTTSTTSTTVAPVGDTTTSSTTVA